MVYKYNPDEEIDISKFIKKGPAIYDPNKKIDPKKFIKKGPAIIPKKKLTEEELKRHINLLREGPLHK
tara:strand:- start:250 stop:453 length:204 start_codon:yes stop_codon:yes gene_type:complete